MNYPPDPTVSVDRKAKMVVRGCLTGHIREVEFKNGTLTISGDFNPLDLNADELQLISAIVKLIDRFESSEPGNGS
jgi:hypothetical protein